ncbi:MAG TPA: DNA-directed RNA polymerase subunit omega [Vicinamibacteria bacterium]|nr:DNA-directed RNA polymerase subunit omega [Vicinamibacteria bacterium]
MDLTQAGSFLRVNVAAQRARQLMQGAAPMVATRSRKPAAIAIQEVEEGLVQAFAPSELPESMREAAFGPEESEAVDSDLDI